MKIVTTFVQGLYAFKYPNEDLDELQRHFRLWRDTEFLEFFFSSQPIEDVVGYWKFEDVYDAIGLTIEFARAWNVRIREKSKLVDFALDDFFIPLSEKKDDKFIIEIPLNQKKSREKWLRLYALKIASNEYVITGGAIKLTLKMQDRPHTSKELEKLERCSTFLKSNGVVDLESFEDFFQEIS